jgi:hypothetical protein
MSHHERFGRTHMRRLGALAIVCALAVTGGVAVPAAASAAAKRERKTYRVKLRKRHAAMQARASSAAGLATCTLSITFNDVFDDEEAAGFNACSVPMTGAVLSVQVGFGAPDFVSPAPDALPDVFAVFTESQPVGRGRHSVQGCIHVSLAAGDEVGSASACLPRVTIGVL